MTKKIMIVYGTRPEGVKVAPVIKALKKSSTMTPFVVSTGQHFEMLDQVNQLFHIKPDSDLKIFETGQSLSRIAAKIFTRLDPILEEVKPDALLVQGDTTTVSTTALAAFYRQIPVVHLEAGLRSGNLQSPFPEEANRIITSQISSLHLAPTEQAKNNLIRNGIHDRTIAVTGNTVIDALQHTLAVDVEFHDERIRDAIESGKRILLMTTHRRENMGGPMKGIAQALRRIAVEYPDDLIVFPMHRNPDVRRRFVPVLEGLPNVILTEPLGYPEFTHLLAACHTVLTDSGGIQEEAPSLGKPVLVLRENTERPEGVEAGTARLIGTEPDRIVAEVSLLKDSTSAYTTMSKACNPYGDGLAAQRVLAAIEQLLGIGKRLPDFGTDVPLIRAVPHAS